MKASGEVWDLVVAGGGPAGLACAIAAAKRGMHVCVVDGQQPPIDKACGEGLMPDTVAALAELDVDRSRILSAGYPLQGIRFVRNDAAVESRFPDGEGAGLHRAVLHDLLHESALALGVGFKWRTTITGLGDGELRTNRGHLKARWIVGADGPRSGIRRMAGIQTAASSRCRMALRQRFSLCPWTDFVEVHWVKEAQAYVTPVSDTEICFAFLGRRRFAGVEEALSLFPALKERVRSAAPSGSARGAMTMSRRLKRVTSGNVALIGDASGSVDAITGEGLALCFRQAKVLARALELNDLSLYEREHARLLQLPEMMSRAMLMLDRYPGALATTFFAFQRSNELFSHLLQIHIGHRPLRLLGSGGLFASMLTILSR